MAIAVYNTADYYKSEFYGVLNSIRNLLSEERSQDSIHGQEIRGRRLHVLLVMMFKRYL